MHSSFPQRRAPEPETEANSKRKGRTRRGRLPPVAQRRRLAWRHTCKLAGAAVLKLRAVLLCCSELRTREPRNVELNGSWRSRLRVTRECGGNSGGGWTTVLGAAEFRAKSRLQGDEGRTRVLLAPVFLSPSVLLGLKPLRALPCPRPGCRFLGERGQPAQAPPNSPLVAQLAQSAQKER